MWLSGGGNEDKRKDNGENSKKVSRIIVGFRCNPLFSALPITVRIA